MEKPIISMKQLISHNILVRPWDRKGLLGLALACWFNAVLIAIGPVSAESD